MGGVATLVSDLKHVGFPHLHLLGNIETPDFELVASILAWIVRLLSPAFPIQAREISTESERAQFLDGVAAELSTWMNLKIDVSSLLSSSGDRAVDELLKVTSVLCDATTSVGEEDTTPVDEEETLPDVDALKSQAQSMAHEITQISQRLGGYLENNAMVDSEERDKVLQFLGSVSSGGAVDGSEEQEHVESRIARALETTNAAVERLDKQCKIMISDQRGMEEKIRKKSIDLERTSKRLESLEHVRPAYMDEYEQLEKELEVEYERYVVRLRNADYLEQELSWFQKAAQERQQKAERSMKRMQERYREEELRILNGDDGEGDEPPKTKEVLNDEAGGEEEIEEASARNSEAGASDVSSEHSFGGSDSFDEGSSEMTGSIDSGDSDSDF